MTDYDDGFDIFNFYMIVFNFLLEFLC